MIDDIPTLVAAANAPLADPRMNITVGDDRPRFELYHFALSLCSQKVRACLAEKCASYVAHDINLQMPLLGNYDPSYVRLRMAANPGKSFATGYTGRSSVETEGFDPAVVPTIVDLAEARVIVDSATICRHVDHVVGPADSLAPPDLEGCIAREIAIVDGTPHVAALYGAHPDGDFRPERLRKAMPGVHDRKIEKLLKARDMAEGDAELVAAFDAKIAKEEAGRAFVHSPDKMRKAIGEMVDIVAALETRPSDGRTWICGDRFTLADVVWAVSLFRMKWLGMSFVWEGGSKLNRSAQPRVEIYGRRLFDRPAFRAAAIDWPGVPRSEYVADHYLDRN